MHSNFIPRTDEVSLGQHFIDAAAAKLSFTLELKKTTNWGSTTHLYWEIYPFGSSLVVRRRIARLCRSNAYVGQRRKLSDREPEL